MDVVSLIAYNISGDWYMDIHPSAVTITIGSSL